MPSVSPPSGNPGRVSHFAEGELVSPRDGLNTSLLQLGAWNLQGKTSDSALDVLHDLGMELHVLALQEVGGVASDEESQTVNFSLHEGYMLLTVQPASCFRALSLAIDEDCVSSWCSAGVGHSHLCALIQLPFFSQKRRAVPVHLPQRSPHGRLHGCPCFLGN